MAAVADPSNSTDLEKLVKDMEKVLPPYARPVFLRFLPEVNKTGEETTGGVTQHITQIFISSSEPSRLKHCGSFFPSHAGTFKFQKTELRRDGFDPGAVSDRLYFLDASRGRFTPLDQEQYNAVLTGKHKL